MRPVSPRALLSLLALLGPTPLLSAQTVLSGVVRDSATGTPIPHAEVLVRVLNRQEVTDAQGRFAMFTLPGGRHLVLVRAVGYRPAAQPIDVAAIGTTRADFTLATEAVALDSMVVESRRIPRSGNTWGYEAFEERRRTLAHGLFLDSTFFRRNEDVDFRAALRRGGVLLDRGTNRQAAGRPGVRLLRQPAYECLLPLWVDGRRWEGIELRNLHPSQVMAVEVYRSMASTPPQFYLPDQECGAIVVWTRRRV